MKLEMNPTNRLIAIVLLLVALAVAFWMLLLSPKREEAKELGTQVEALEVSLAGHEAEVAEGEAAREEFPAEYRRLVVLGKAVPGDDETASLLVQLNKIADDAGGEFKDFKLTAGGGEAQEQTPSPPGAEPVSATEATASLLPLGARVGPAGLGVMPYEVTFNGNFFGVADFIEGLDSLVESGDEGVTVDGRLATIDSFSLEADSEKGFPYLKAGFSLTTYLTPPDQGVTGGATPSAPPPGGTPVATTTGGAP